MRRIEAMSTKTKVPHLYSIYGEELYFGRDARAGDGQSFTQIHTRGAVDGSIHPTGKYGATK